MAVNGIAEFEARLIATKFNREFDKVTREIKGAPDLLIGTNKEDIEKFRREIGAITPEINRAGKAGLNLQSVISGLAGGAAFAALGAITQSVKNLASAMLGVIRSTVEIGGAAEQSRVAFTTMLGGAEAAQKTLNELSDFAATTPFDLPGVRAAGQQLLAFGVTPETLIDTLTRLGDIAAGTGTNFGELAEIFGKAKVQGRLFAEDINQLTGRGIPVIGALANVLGVAESEVKSLVSEGKVGFPQLEQAFISLTAEGSKFGGLMSAQSRTIPGQLSNIQDGFVRLQESTFNAFAPATAAGLQLVSDILAETGENFDGFDKLTAAGERLADTLERNPEIAEQIGKALGDLADEGVTAIANITDSLSDFLADGSGVELMADQLENLADVISVVGAASAFIIDLSTASANLIKEGERLPLVGDNLTTVLNPLTSFNGLLAIATDSIEALGNRIQGLLDRIGQIAPVLAPAIAQLQKIPGLGGSGKVPTVGVGATDTAGQLKALANGLQGLKAQPQAQLPTPSDSEVADAEDRLKALAEANKAALEQITLDTQNARNALLSSGTTQAALATEEEKGLAARITQARAYLANVRALEAAGILSKDDAKGRILEIENEIAATRGQILESQRKRVEDATQAETKATEEAAKASLKAREAANKSILENIEQSNKLAEAAIENSTRRQNQSLRAAVLAGYKTTEDAALASVDAAIQANQKQIDLIENRKRETTRMEMEQVISAEDAKRRRVELETELGSVQLDRIDLVLDREEAAQNAVIAALKTQSELEKQSLENLALAVDLTTERYDSQLRLNGAQLGLEQALGDLQQQRFSNAASAAQSQANRRIQALQEEADATDDQTKKEEIQAQIKAIQNQADKESNQLALQAAREAEASLARQQAFERESLAIKQEIAKADAENLAIQQQIALLESQTALAEAQRLNKSDAEIANLQKIVGLREQAVNAANGNIARLAQLQSLERQEVGVRQQKDTEQAQFTREELEKEATGSLGRTDVDTGRVGNGSRFEVNTAGLVTSFDQSLQATLSQVSAGESLIATEIRNLAGGLGVAPVAQPVLTPETLAVQRTQLDTSGSSVASRGGAELKDVVQRIDRLERAILTLAASPRQLSVTTPDPVADTGKIMRQISERFIRDVNA